MVKRWLWIVVTVVVLAGLVVWRIIGRNQQAAQLAAGGSGGPGGGAPGGRGGSGGGRMAPTVQLAPATSGQIVSTIESVGSLESPERVLISPKTTGRIDFLQVREGDPVTPGQVLVRIDPTQLQAQVLQQQAAVAEAQSRLAQAQLQENPNTVGIASQIEQQRAGLVSAQADQSQTERNYEATVATAQAAVTDAQAKLQAAQSGVNNSNATLGQQNANLQNATTKYNRTYSLYQQGFVAAQDVDDAKTAMQVAQGAVQVAQAQLSSSRQSVNSARAQLSSAQNQLAIAKRKGLSDITASQAKTTQARATLSVATANTANNPAYLQNLAALRASVAAAQAQLAQARSQLADTVLRSPIKGAVTARSADPGSMASPGSTILTLQSIDWLYATSSIPIEESANVYGGQVAQISVDALPGRTFTGTISNVNPAADPQSRQFSIRIKLPNPTHELKPGMFGHIDIVTRSVNADVTVPREALETNRDGSKYVVVVGDDMKAQVRPVKVGAANAKSVQILQGVNAGENVVVLTYQPLRDGQTVRLPGAAGGRGGAAGGPAGAANGGGRRRRGESQ